MRHFGELLYNCPFLGGDMKQKSLAGIIGLAGAAVFITSVVISILMFERGTYSPVNCFTTELGIYAGASVTFSSALVFNIGLILSGLAFSVFMVMYGLRGETLLDTAVSFFGVLSGMLMAGEGLFSLNFFTFHCVLSSAFFVTLFIMCVLYVVSKTVSGSRRPVTVQTLAALLTGVAAALSAMYMITGGMSQIFAEDTLGIGRLSVIPFAIIGWAAYALFLIFIAAAAARMLEKEKPSKPEPASPSSGSGNKKKR